MNKLSINLICVFSMLFCTSQVAAFGDGKQTVVFFRMQGNPHGTVFYPQWKKLVKTCGARVSFEIIEAANIPKHLQYEVRGFPTIMLLDKKGNHESTYHGNRSVKDLRKWIRC